MAFCKRRTEPGEDVITALVRAEEEHDSLSASEILGWAVLLLIAWGLDPPLRIASVIVRGVQTLPLRFAAWA